MLRIKNNTGGYLSIQLPDYTGMRETRFFRMPNKNSQISIPDEYAKSIATDIYAFRAYQKGLFVCLNGEDIIINAAIENGLIEPEKAQTVQSQIVPNALLLAALRDGTVAKVQEYLNSPNRERLIDLAQEHYKEISPSKIEAIEEKTGISLQIE